MQAKQRTPEMEALLQNSKALLKIYRKERTEEAKENFKEAERQRYKQHYKENTKMENQRTKEYKQKQSLIIVMCSVCGVELQKTSFKNHLKSKTHLAKTLTN